jgi:hypothetical protein
MVLKNVLTAAACSVLLVMSGLALADEYRPDEFLSLDLSTAVLSPKRLGPPTEFAPVPVEANADRGEGAQARVEPKAEPKIAESRPAPHIVVRNTRVAHVRSEHPRGAARTRLAHRHGNPLDAQAFDTRIQVWPCRSGGICNWKH